MAKPIEKMYRVKNPSNGEIHSMTYANARDMVTHRDWTWVKGEKVVLKEAQKEALDNAYLDGNDPSKLNVEALAAQYAELAAPENIDEMGRDELLAYALSADIEVDQRHGREKLLAEIKSALAAGNSADGAADGDNDGED